MGGIEVPMLFKKGRFKGNMWGCHQCHQIRESKWLHRANEAMLLASRLKARPRCWATKLCWQDTLAGTASKKLSTRHVFSRHPCIHRSNFLKARFICFLGSSFCSFFIGNQKNNVFVKAIFQEERDGGCS